MAFLGLVRGFRIQEPCCICGGGEHERKNSDAVHRISGRSAIRGEPAIKGARGHDNGESAWVFHALLPISAYATMAASAWASVLYGPNAMFGVAAAALILLFVGIHNAWDAVTYHIFVGKHDRQ